MANKSISNTGPIIHLSEIELTYALESFGEVLISSEVKNELKKRKVEVPVFVKILDLAGEWKNFVMVLTNEEGLDLGEASAIALTLQEKANLFFTDDLEARIAAKKFNIEVHGTIGIILRLLREKKIDKKTAILKIKELQERSSLFITSNLIEQAIDAIEEF